MWVPIPATPATTATSTRMPISILIGSLLVRVLDRVCRLPVDGSWMRCGGRVEVLDRLPMRVQNSTRARSYRPGPRWFTRPLEWGRASHSLVRFLTALVHVLHHRGRGFQCCHG